MTWPRPPLSVLPLALFRRQPQASRPPFPLRMDLVRARICFDCIPSTPRSRRPCYERGTLQVYVKPGRTSRVRLVYESFDIRRHPRSRCLSFALPRVPHPYLRATRGSELTLPRIWKSAGQLRRAFRLGTGSGLLSRPRGCGPCFLRRVDALRRGTSPSGDARPVQSGTRTSPRRTPSPFLEARNTLWGFKGRDGL